MSESVTNKPLADLSLLIILSRLIKSGGKKCVDIEEVKKALSTKQSRRLAVGMMSKKKRKNLSNKDKIALSEVENLAGIGTWF